MKGQGSPSLETLFPEQGGNEYETAVSSFITKVYWSLLAGKRATYQVGSSRLCAYIKKHT